MGCNQRSGFSSKKYGLCQARTAKGAMSNEQRQRSMADERERTAEGAMSNEQSGRDRWQMSASAAAEGAMSSGRAEIESR